MNAEPRSCASCDEIACGMHRLLPASEAPTDKTSWVLDCVWPETASLVAHAFRPNHQLIAPGIWRGYPRRYAWPAPVERSARFSTLRRHLVMRRVANATGAVRQQTYLRHDRALALRLARRVDYRAQHLVVAQAWLPWLDEAGALGGRTFDVIMSRYPFGEIHRLLDEAAAEMKGSRTITDFRASRELVEREAQLLSRARRIYTPHHGIASIFPEQAVTLSWHKPAPRPRGSGRRVAFLGPTIARQRPDIASRLARGLDQPLVVFGSIPELLWGDLPIERRDMGPHWLDDIGAILHPATLTHEPRALLEARANGVIIYATAGCGLPPEEFFPLESFSAAQTND